MKVFQRHLDGLYDKRREGTIFTLNFLFHLLNDIVGNTNTFAGCRRNRRDPKTFHVPSPLAISLYYNLYPLYVSQMYCTFNRKVWYNSVESEVTVMHLVVGGCRQFNDYARISAELDRILQAYEQEDIVLLSGHCSGVDTLAERYAEEHGLEVEIYPAEWRRYGRAAGPIRNEQMVMRADCVIAFWDGQSRGTKSLISYAEKHGKKWHVISV